MTKKYRFEIRAEVEVEVEAINAVQAKKALDQIRVVGSGFFGRFLKHNVSPIQTRVKIGPPGYVFQGVEPTKKG